MKLPHSIFSFIAYYVRQQWFKFSVLVFTSIAWGVNDSFFPYFLKRIINTLQQYQGAREQVMFALKGTLILLVVFWLFSEILNRLQGFVFIYTMPRFRAQIRASVFDYVKSHSHEYFSSHFSGNIAKKLSDLPTSSEMIMEIICIQFVAATTGAIVVAIMMWQTHIIFAVLLLIWLCLHLGLTTLFIMRSNYLWEKHADAVSTLGGKIIDALTNILNVRLFAHGQYESRYLQHYQKIEINKAKKAMFTMEWTRVGLGLSGLFLIFSMLFTLLYGWVHGWVNLGDFTQVGMQAFWLLGWVWFISFQMTVLAREIGTVGDALKLIRVAQDVVDKPQSKPIQIAKGEIIFDQVTFAYRKNNPVFHDFSLTIPAGQKVGLVGFSGSGKTTFVNLILRFYDIQAGKIVIDGQNIADVTQDSLRAQISMIPQDPSLFHRTLLENIRYGRLDATDQEVIQAAKLAHCHEFIEKLEEGYDSLVGERGIKLSGGQRQRIAIARAILKNAPILILDEATSSLDSVTEKLIQDSLHYLMRDKTTIVVAHRLSTLANMDYIVVFHHGKIVEAGTQKNLLTLKGHFAKLWHRQSDGFLPD